MAELWRKGADGIVCVCSLLRACRTTSWARRDPAHPCAFPDANIVAIRLRPRRQRVNQLNRIKLMLTLAHDKIAKAGQDGVHKAG